MQWHPLFAELLRPVVEAYYEVQTNVPVGDVPREPDIVLLRRKTEAAAPFRGIWSLLTAWNVLEFKSPDVVPKVRDLDLLVELGLGIDRRLNEERSKHKLQPRATDQVSFWYLANRLTKRFLGLAEQRLGNIEPLGAGAWKAKVMARPVILVGNADLPVDSESVPLHLVSRGPHATELAVARFVIEQPQLREVYSSWVLALHEQAWKEVRAMSRVLDDEVKINVKRVAEFIGVERLVKQVGLQRVIKDVGLKQVIDEVGLKQVIDEVGLKQVIDEVGLKQVIDEVGLKRVIDEAGLAQLVNSIGIDGFLANLTPAQRRDLKRRLR